MIRFFTIAISAITVFFFLHSGINAQDKAPIPAEANDDAVNAFIDCDFCDHDFIRTEIEFVDFVRDRLQADVHILIIRQWTGSGGSEYTLTFIGQKDFKGKEDTLKFIAAESDTDDTIRREMVRIIKMGLIPYISGTPLAKKISIKYLKPEKLQEIVDKWNNWVFSISLDGWLNGQKSYNSISLYGDLSANRVTEDIKLEFSTYSNYYESNYDYGDVVVSSFTRSRGFYARVVPSINDHWSLASTFQVYSSTYSNKDLASWLAAGIEYNIFPYSESTRRQLRFEYVIGHEYIDYEKKTIYFEHSEHRLKEHLISELEFIQPWGSASASLSASNYLHDFEIYRLSIYGEISVRLFEGFSIKFSGNASRIRDQIYLVLEDPTTEEILLQRRALPTTYDYWFSFGLTYSFGSIYTHVVNPRFD